MIRQSSLNLLWEFSFHTTDVLLLHLTVPYLVLHLTSLLWAAAEQQQTRRKAIQPMYRAQVLQVVFFGENKDNCVVTITAAWMNLQVPRTRRKREQEEETNNG